MRTIICWAHNKDGHRCDIDTAEHHPDPGSGEYLHAYTVAWTDAETVSPTGGVSTLVPVLRPAAAVVGGEPLMLGCLACTCTEDAHGDAGCDEHGCYAYVAP